MIEGIEGVRLTAYRDIAGVWTIGYGPHRRGSEGRDHHRGPSLPRSLQAADRSNIVTQFNA
jgi:GH24 family phage-related lysozyme (muramidase)